MISSDHLEPGTKGSIRATVDTTGRSGHLEKHVTLYSNDRRNPALTLTVAADVLPK